MTRSPNFLALQIEPVSACNLNCPICLRTQTESSDAFLSVQDFQKIVNSGRFDFVSLHGWGEPLLHPELTEMIRLAHEQGIITQLTTNATLLKDWQEQLLASPLNEIAFGFYSLERLQGLASAIGGFLAARGETGSPKAYLDVAMHNSNRDQIDALIDLAAQLGIEAVILHRLFDRHLKCSGFSRLSDPEEKAVVNRAKKRAKRLGLEFYPPLGRQRPCFVAQHSIFVNVRGEVCPCCFQPGFSLGSALESGVLAIRKSRMYGKFMNRMTKNPICNDCPF